MSDQENIPPTVVKKLSPEKLYDVCAPAVYGKILSIVQDVPIADRLLEKVFVNAFNDEKTFTGSTASPLITLLKKSTEKSTQTISALKILNECCAGSTVSITDIDKK